MQPIFTVFTPVHAEGSKFLLETYESLRAQTFLSWEWVLLENNGGKVPEEIRKDPRVILASSEAKGIGALKKEACSYGSGTYLVELDSDDLLTPKCLDHLLNAFEKGADFAYSNFAEFTGDRQPVAPFSEAYGWSHHENKKGLRVMHAPEASAQNLRLVEWAPNHVRAWRRDFYMRIGGHDASFPTGDDHDLCVRTYLAGGNMLHVKKCLYLYRLHETNTVKVQNASIRSNTWRVYNEKIWALANEWARRGNLLKIDLCGGYDTPEGYTSIDKRPGKEGSIQCDLDGPWQLEKNSVGVLRAQDAIEHLRDPVHVMNEAYRVLAPGGFFLIHVPSANGQGAFMDPTHRSFWNPLSFGYYTDRLFAKYLPEFTGRFQVTRIQEWRPTFWHEMNNVPYVEAHLIALKPGYHPYGEVKI